LRNGAVAETIGFESHVTSLSFDHSRIAVCAGGNGVEVVNRQSGLASSFGLSQAKDGWIGHVKPARSVLACGEQGSSSRVLSSGMDGVVKIWK
jgi:hypothetical protein